MKTMKVTWPSYIWQTRGNIVMTESIIEFFGFTDSKLAALGMVVEALLNAKIP
jgi:hypothetical protein